VTDPTPFESALRRDRWLIGGALGAVTLLCWAWLVPMGRDMYGPMTGASAWMMTERWDWAHLLLLFAMWVVMMAGMMLPSATPTLLLYAGVVRKSGEAEHTPSRVHVFAEGYLVVWTGFSLLATAGQRVLSELLLLSSMMESQNRLLGSLLVFAAGVYQLTPFKRTCLDYCRSPAEFIVKFWRPGAGGAFRLGLTHGLYCLGCCWALMLLLFVGGVMNLWCIMALTMFVLLEKLAPFGVQGGRLSGWLLIVFGLWLLAR
jgi:predicted metal-binding membrane protein